MSLSVSKDQNNNIKYLQGQVKGTYVIALPDGRIQTTSYTADPINGYVAEVSYQGEPVYPDPPQQPRPAYTNFE